MRKLENKKLDEIGKVVVKAAAIPNRDIEKIVAGPELFESIRRRIAAGTETPTPRRSRLVIPGVATFASVALLAVIGLAFFKSGNVKPVQQQPVSSVSKPEVPRPVDVPKYSESDRVAYLTPVPQHASVKSDRYSSRPAQRVPREKHPVAHRARYVDDFYAVSYAGDPHETERGSRIVRVDIPRSTLFAMGINVPLENESATVKADLLVGSDGVTRGIRVVE
ncbi:MAG TPA: hypothetical protein VNA22_04935 [Pyrinomonadaceae bacterium]|nr:hypothetical protein [Pyrinomonadaceae bacterium]